jgi:predicted RNA binding protein YcfA (HicA-like mRNA interferase family)
MDEIIFIVEEAPEGGYSARALGAPIFTEADDLETLQAELRDAVLCHFGDDADRPRVIRLHLSGDDLARALAALGYSVTRQTGSHMRLTTQERGEHHITIPRHDALRVGTVAAILGEVGEHFTLSREAIVDRLFAR